MHQRLYPDRSPADLFPVLRLEQLEAAGPEYAQRLYVELVREAATLVMLAAIALAVARNVRQWFAAFLITFGLWDIFFYVFLRGLIRWPTSLFDWDLLFLLPVPWVGPVLAPVLVALAMIVAGTVLLRRESLGRPVRLAAGHWTAMLLSGLIVVFAFCLDCRNILAGGLPRSFQWPLFALGILLGMTGFLHAVSRRGQTLLVNEMRADRRPTFS